MILFALMVALSMAGMLLWAGLEKGRDLESSASTMRALGVPLRYARPAAMVLSITEICTAFGLVFQPTWAITQIGVVSLAMAFAFAGMIALHRDEPIRCGCFGLGAGGYLGRNQIIAIIPWVTGATVLYVGLQEPLSLSAGALRLYVLGLTLATLRVIAVARAWREARGDRLSAMEMYAWPR